jgi:PilZ domain
MINLNAILPAGSFRVKSGVYGRRSGRRELVHPLMTCLVTTDSDSKSYAAKPRNLSLTGMAFSLPVPIAPNTVFYVTLTNALCLYTVIRAAEVRYNYDGDLETFITGCEFLEPLTHEELRMLLA